MEFEQAYRLTQILTSLAFIQQSIEHIRLYRNEIIIFSSRIIFSLILLSGLYTGISLIALFIIALLLLVRFQGPYNGGADRMSLLVLCCLCLVQILPDRHWQEVAFGYLALQLVLSYFIAGWVKVINPEWRNGQALSDVFGFSVYPVSESLRRLSSSHHLLVVFSWLVILFELLFPLSLLFQQSLILALACAAIFHFSNACFFGLNRFLWIWIAAFPSILWLQDRLVQHL